MMQWIRWGKICGVAIAIYLLLGFSCAFANNSHVQFDASRVVECRDVSSADFLQTHPHDKSIEIRMSISVLNRQGHESNLGEVLYRLALPNSGYQVLDFAPKTTLASGFAGNIAVQSDDRTNKSLALNFSGHYGLFAKGDGLVTFDSKRRTSLSGELQPPQELIAAAGTTGGGSGIFFKLRPSPWTSLEGANEFVVVVRVPKTWRGDFAILTCQAFRTRSEVLFAEQQHVRSGAANFLLGLHMQGDSEFRTAADRMLRCENELRVRIAEFRSNFTRQKNAKSWPGLTELFSDSTEALPADWLEQLVLLGSWKGKPLRRHLPPDVRSAAEDFLAARQQLHSASGLNLVRTTHHHVAKPQIAAGS